MKRLVILLASIILSLECFAGNTLSLSNVSGHPGDVIQMSIALDKTDPIVALEVKIPLNDNISYVEGSASLNSNRSNGHSVSAQSQDGILSFYVFSFSNNELKGESGNLVSFNLKLSKEPTTYALVPTVIASNASGTALDVETVNGSVTLLSPKITVVTETVDYGHIPIKSQYSQNVTIRNSGNETLVVSNVQFSAPELSTEESSFSVLPGDTRSLNVNYSPIQRGKITESMTFVSNAVNGNAKASIIADPFSVNELHTSNAEGISDSNVEISLTMNNMEPIVAVQCLFYLPDALHYVDGSLELSERASRLSKMAFVDGNKLTIYIYSNNNDPISGSDGKLATFKLLLDGSSGYYSLYPESILLGNSDMENMTSASSGGYVIIKSPTIYCSNSLDMEHQDITKTVTSSFPITNNGQVDLVVNKVNFLSDGFSIKESLPLTISSGDTKNITVCHDANLSGQFDGTMNIYSNDPSNRLVPVSVSGYAYEPNSINLSGQFINQCADYCLNIGLDNYTEIVGIQMDLNVPTGLDCGSQDLVGTQRVSGLNSSVTKMSEGKYRIIVFSMNNDAIKNNTGDIFNLTLHSSCVLNEGATISISSIVLSGRDGKNYSSANNAVCAITYPVYKLTYKVDGIEYRFDSLAYGSAITPETSPTKEGYTFSGWSEIPATMPAQDVEITGSFTVNKYILTYKVDGEVYERDTIAFGTAVTPAPAPTKEGYTFSGWSGIPAIMPANNIDVTASFGVNTYNLVYKVDGQFYKTYHTEYGSAITPETSPTKEGYTFSGWSEIPATMPAQDVEITGSFTVNKYILTYKVDGEVYERDTIAFGDAVTPAPAPTKEELTFSGWSGIPATMPAKNVEVTGCFTVNKYILTYKVDGEVYRRDTIAFGAAVTPAPAPTKLGYTFSGWSGVPATMLAKDVEATASFGVNTYNLVYKVDGQVYKTYHTEFGTAITPETAPTKEGYTFSGWSEIPDSMSARDVEVNGTFSINSYLLVYKVLFEGDTSVYKFDSIAYNTPLIPEPGLSLPGYSWHGWDYVPSTMPAYDVEIIGTISINSYVLTYKIDEEIYRKDTIALDATVTPAPAPTKEGYTFSGWSEIPATMPANDVEVNGTFSINSYLLVYKVLFEGDTSVYKFYSIAYNTPLIPEPGPALPGYSWRGWDYVPLTMPAYDFEIVGTLSSNFYVLTYKIDGEIYRKDTIALDATVTPAPAPTKEGYTFSGWSEIPATMPANDVEVTGSFTVNKYILTYKVDGEVYRKDTIDFSTTVTPESAPTKEGYTFFGWSEIPATMPAHDVEVTGSFSVNKYILTYKVDGEVYRKDTIAYGATATSATAPTKEGYTFSGWSEIPATMPAKDVEVTGSFSVNKYILTYKVDGEIYRKDTIAYGATVTSANAPTKEGYTFSGWSEIPTTMPAQNVEVTGSFTVNKYLLTVLLDGEVVFSDSIAYGTRLADYVDLIIQLGFDISQWEYFGQIESITMPAHDVTINAVRAFIKPVFIDLDKPLIYDLTGKKIDSKDIYNLSTGIYIINGRKYVIP